MPRLSTAFKRLETRLDEVHHLNLVAKKYIQLKSIINDPDKSAHTNALVRAATVLLSSHIQGYIEDLSDVVLNRLVEDNIGSHHVPDSLRFHAAKTAIKELKEADNYSAIKKIREFNVTYDDILRLSGPVSPDFLGSEYKDGFGNPTVKEISRFFGRFGLNDFLGQMGKRLKSEWPIVENAVNQIVDRRNKIAHGDIQATLTVLELSQYIKLSRKFASSTDRVVTSHFGRVGCKFW